MFHGHLSCARIMTGFASFIVQVWIGPTAAHTTALSTRALTVPPAAAPPSRGLAL